MIEEFTVKNVHKIAVISDTHVPDRFDALREQVFDEFQGVDLVLHAGDATDFSVIQDLRGIAEVIAVYGNMCNNSMRDEVPFKCIIHVGNFKIGLIHGHGFSPHALQKSLLEEFKRDGFTPDCIVYGHTHIPQNEIIDGVLFFNPGAGNPPTNGLPTSVGFLDIDSVITGQIVPLIIPEPEVVEPLEEEDDDE